MWVYQDNSNNLQLLMQSTLQFNGEKCEQEKHVKNVREKCENVSQKKCEIKM